MRNKIEPYFTTVREGHKYSNLTMVKAIQMLEEAMCVILPEEKAYDYVYYPGYGWRLCVCCTKAAYERFTEVVDEKFHGLCQFDM